MNKIIEKDIKKYINWLKTKCTVSIYRCNVCHYSQGHPIVYCSKCSGRMVHIKNEPYLESFKEEYAEDHYGEKSLLFYKHEFTRLLNKEISWNDWYEVVDKIMKKEK